MFLPSGTTQRMKTAGPLNVKENPMKTGKRSSILLNPLVRAAASGIAAAVLLAWFLATAATGYALSSGEVSISGITPYAALDSNNACTQGPRAMFMQANVKNTSAATLAGLSASFGGFTSTAFALAGGESAYRYIGALAPNATASLFWHINYTCTIGVSANYTVSVADSRAGIVTSGPLTLTTRSELSSPAGGDVGSVVLGQGAVVGQIVPYTVSYNFGNPSSSADAMIQPAGNTNFASSCYRLVSDDIIASNFTTGPLITADNQLYFPSVSGGSSNSATVVYLFEALCTGVNTAASPFADQKSGGQLKYTSNYSTALTVITLPAATNAFTISKSANPAYLPAGGTVTYTVTVSNISNFSAFADQIVDDLPAGVTFGGIAAGSQVTAGNSGISPTVGATGVISWAGIALSSYNVPANGAVRLVYTATVSSTPGQYSNSASVVAATVITGPSVASVSVGSADMAVAISATPSPATVSQTLHYSLAITNAGPTSATDVVVTTTLPGSVIFGSASPNQGSCNLAGALLVCALGGMSNGAAASISLIVTPTVATLITATAQVAAGQIDPDQSNNSATAAVLVNSAPTFVTEVRLHAEANDRREPNLAAVLAGALTLLAGLLLYWPRRTD
jgi:uncharacterized repeat protein (TIGR01451 family)